MRKVLLCGELFDAVDGIVFPNKAVVIEGNIITEILDLADYNKLSDDEVVDLSQKFVMPGLTDAHVHLGFSGKIAITELNEPAELVALKGLKNAQDDLMGGFTTVRDVGFPTLQGAQQIRDAIKQGIVWGPRVFTTGLWITQTGGHLATSFPQERYGVQNFKPVNTADSADEVRTAARTMLKYGTDQLKLMVTGGVLSNSGGVGEQNMSFEEIQAAVEVGKMHNKLISVHAHGTAGIKAAAKAGVSTIEHCTMADDESIDYMVKNNVAAVPTFIVLKLLAEEGPKNGVAPSACEKSASLVPYHLENIKKAYDKGVRIIFGTDTGTPLGIHGKQHAEFGLMVKAGIDPVDTLLAATRYSAELLGWDHQLGTIENGKLADIIAVNGNPLNDMSTMCADNISFVMKDGIVYKS